MAEELPFVMRCIEYVDVIEIFALIVLPPEDDQIAMQSVHGVPVTSSWPQPFWLQLDPLQLAHLLQVNFPDIVEVEANYEGFYFSAVLYVPPKMYI